MQVSVPVAAACPHCGNAASLSFEGRDAFCVCSRCHARGPRVTLENYSDHAGVCAAIEAYNRRIVMFHPIRPK